MGPPTFTKITLDDFDDVELEEAFDNYENTSAVAPQVKAMAALRMVPLTAKYVRGLVDAGEVEGPIIIYTDHVDACHALAKEFDTVPITGAMPVGEREKIATAFQDGKMPFLTATIGSFSTGVTLTRSNFMVLNDFPWVPGTLQQVAYRINRTGQTRSCHVHMIFGSRQAEYIFDQLHSKSLVIAKVY
jgi:superfamily II DNA or RNA helicase